MDSYDPFSVDGFDAALGWTLSDDVVNTAYGGYNPSVGYPSSGAVIVDGPEVQTGGLSWDNWVEKLALPVIQLRNAWAAGDARQTSYPGTGLYGMSGQTATGSGVNLSGLLLLGAFLFGAYLIVKS